MIFLPEGYESPKSNCNYLKFKKGMNKFRAVSSAVVGYEYWNNDNKPVRLHKYPENMPVDIRKKDDGTPTEIKHFWAFSVIDRADGQIKLLSITQKGVMREIESLVSNKEWGSPQAYDITVQRDGDGLETTYTIQPSPHVELTQEEKQLIANTPINLHALFEGKDPFEVMQQEQPGQGITAINANPSQVTYDPNGNPDALGEDIASTI